MDITQRFRGSQRGPHVGSFIGTELRSTNELKMIESPSIVAIVSSARGSVTAGTAGITPCCCLSKKQEVPENIKETWFNDVKHSQRLSVRELNQYFCVNAHKNGSRTGGFWPLKNQNMVPCVAPRA